MTLLADWLQTLGTATLGALWVPLLAWTAVAFVAMSLLRLWRSVHTLVHYTTRAALLLALPLGLLLAAVTDLSILALFPSPAAETSIEPIFILPLMDFNPTPGAPAAPAWTLYHLLGLLTMLAGVLAAGRLYYLARHALALTRFRRRLPRHLDAPVQQAVDRQAAALGIQRHVRAVVITQDVVPMTLGWLRPIIVVPEALTGDEEHLHMTLLHELIHIRRQDVLLQGVEYVIGALFLINPAVWLLRRSIGQYREMSCDAEVVTQPRVSSKRYAALLYRFASPPSYRRRLALSMSASDHELKKRILAMKSHLRSAHRWLSPKFIGFALAALLLTSATAFVACSDLVGSNVVVDETAASKAEVFTNVEEMPELIGGLKAIQAQLHYPKLAKEAGLEGQVIIEFVVDEQGRVIDPKVVKEVGGGLDEEALRVISQARFKPGKEAGKIVSVKIYIPFTFRLNDDEAAHEDGKRKPLDSSAVLSEKEQVAIAMKALPGYETEASVDQMPALIGGLEALRVQIKYPSIAKRAGIEGSVIVEFMVDEQGRVVDLRVVRGLGGGCDEEALRVVKQARFEPAQKDGQPVQVKMAIPITFKLGDPIGQTLDAVGAGVIDIEWNSLSSTLKFRDGDFSQQEETPRQKVNPELIVEADRPRLKVVEVQRTEAGLSGRVVVAETGEGLPGATLFAKKNRIGTATDRDGRFTLPVSPDVTDFKVSFIGFDPVDLHLTPKKNGQGDLNHDDAGTGLSRNEIDYEPNARLDGQGQQQMSALEADANPLYLVDGIPTPGNTRPDPKQLDIESISVLKGAAARALYGARAANGVVEITTVQGRSEH